MKHTKRFPLPEKFHTLIKVEAFKSGKTITKYLNEIADEMEEQNLMFRSVIKKKVKENDRFIPKF